MNLASLGLPAHDLTWYLSRILFTLSAKKKGFSLYMVGPGEVITFKDV